MWLLFVSVMTLKNLNKIRGLFLGLLPIILHVQKFVCILISQPAYQSLYSSYSLIFTDYLYRNDAKLYSVHHLKDLDHKRLNFLKPLNWNEMIQSMSCLCQQLFPPLNLHPGKEMLLLSPNNIKSCNETITNTTHFKYLDFICKVSRLQYFIGFVTRLKSFTLKSASASLFFIF